MENKLVRSLPRSSSTQGSQMELSQFGSQDGLLNVSVVGNHAEKEMSVLPRFNPDQWRYKILALILALSDLGFGLFMGVAAYDAVRLLVMDIHRSLWVSSLAKTVQVICYTIGLTTGASTALMAVDIVHVLGEVYANWMDTTKARDQLSLNARWSKVSRLARLLSILVHFVLWGVLSLGSVIALKELGCNLKKPGWALLAIYLWVGNFWSYLMPFAPDVMVSLANFRELFYSPYLLSEIQRLFKMQTKKACYWALSSAVNVLLKASRQAYLAAWWLDSFFEVPKSGKYCLAIFLFVLAAWETFFTQSWSALGALLKEGDKQSNLPQNQTQTQETKVNAFLFLHFLRSLCSLKFFIELFAKASISLTLSLANMLFLGGFVSSHWVRVSIMLLSLPLTIIFQAPQTANYIFCKVQIGASYLFQSKMQSASRVILPQAASPLSSSQNSSYALVMSPEGKSPDRTSPLPVVGLRGRDGNTDSSSEIQTPTARRLRPGEENLSRVETGNLDLLHMP